MGSTRKLKYTCRTCGQNKWHRKVTQMTQRFPTSLYFLQSSQVLRCCCKLHKKSAYREVLVGSRSINSTTGVPCGKRAVVKCWVSFVLQCQLSCPQARCLNSDGLGTFLHESWKSGPALHSSGNALNCLHDSTQRLYELLLCSMPSPSMDRNRK
jgi:hypothetical protein